jgi:asparagine synthase (glutamine-hydrolysing)
VCYIRQNATLRDRGFSALCGIAGFTHWNRSSVDISVIRKITGSLAHRGPDQQGTFHSRDVSLGAVRLKIIDLAGGDQPLKSDDGDTVVVFNGEIYNHAELRQELESLGHCFHTQCDTEVALHAFLQWDVRCFARFRGMFAVAFWSESAKRLVLGRDRLGIKPLYLHRRGADVYFGSELKTLFGHPEIPRSLNLTALHYYLALNYVPGPHTLVEGIEKLPPGYLLEWQDGLTRIEPYWRLEFQPRPRTMCEATEELDGLLESAVREHMLSDVPLGVWSSGGLDSSTVLHYAAEASGSALKTFFQRYTERTTKSSI